MGFSFRVANYESQIFDDPGDWFEFLDGGVLAIHFGQPGRWSTYHSPGTWQQLTTDQPPGPRHPHNR